MKAALNRAYTILCQPISLLLPPISLEVCLRKRCPSTDPEPDQVAQYGQKHGKGTDSNNHS